MNQSDLWTKDILADVVAWVEDAYPMEGCGLIVERDGAYRVIECENLADKYHEMDPDRFPRTARQFYVVDPREFIAAEERGEQVVVIFHSHADVGDYFSDEDVNAATMPRAHDDASLQPSHPGVDYLVVSTHESGADHATLFRFDAEEQGFPPVAEIDIGPDGFCTGDVGKTPSSQGDGDR